jgi:hypothetical protein
MFSLKTILKDESVSDGTFQSSSSNFWKKWIEEGGTSWGSFLISTASAIVLRSELEA